jgi:hypothetical protein
MRIIRHIDHVTYVARAEEPFVDGWTQLGFREHVRVSTRRYPAAHIALTSGRSEAFPWEVMTGLSVSGDAASPINEFIRRYGEGEQHVAYNIDPAADMDEVARTLTRSGWKFMTPVLRYGDEKTGAGLRQIFVAPERPYGKFTELVQRLPGRDGAPFGGFDSDNIDDLYECYAEYSEWLERRARGVA